MMYYQTIDSFAIIQISKYVGNVFMAEDKVVRREVQRRGARSNQKLKILYLAKILLENTDAQHDITMQEIIDKLAANNVTAERKSLYDDIAQLDDSGIKIKKTQYGKTYHYQVVNRDFETAEHEMVQKG